MSRLAITWLHPLGSLDDQLFQIEIRKRGYWLLTPIRFRDRAVTRNRGIQPEKRLHARPASYGVDLLAAVDHAGTATPRCLPAPDDIATLNYTGGTDRLKQKAPAALAIESIGGFRQRDPADFEFRITRAYLHGRGRQPRRRHQGCCRR